MFDRAKKLVARFYESASGNKPVRVWLLALSQDDRRVIGKDIQKVEFGWPIGRPHCAPLENGMWEVRSNLGGNRIARIVFALNEGEMVLLHGFIKKTQKVERTDLDLALKRLKELT